MRRTVLVLLSLIVSGLVVVSAAPAQALAAPSGVKAVGGDAFDVVTVSWTWSTKPAAYVIQVAEKQSFAGAEQFKVAGKAAKPPGGRQSYRVTGLEDGTKFFVRVAAATKSGSKSGWSAVRTAETRMRTPSPGDNLKAVSGPGPGEVTFSWTTAGDYTDYFRIDTGTSPFDADGPRDHQVFKIDPSKRSYTLSAAQTEAAGAGIGVAWTLIWRFRAVNTGTAGGTMDRYFGQGQSRVPGMAPSGDGAAIRVASYNVRTESVNPSGNEKPWLVRAPLVAESIEAENPGIVLLQELFPSQIVTFQAELALPDMSKYALNRTAAVDTGLPGEKKLQSRFIYDKNVYEDVSQCPDSKFDTSCLIKWESDTGPDYAAVNLMRHKASGQHFWVCSFHLTSGNEYEAVRREAMKSIVAGIEALNTQDYPVILGGDSNSSQLREGIRPHDILMAKGYYDTASAVEHINPEYGTANDFQYQEPSAIGISSRIDLIATLGMPGSAKFKNVVVKKPDVHPSDHNMIWADLKLP